MKKWGKIVCRELLKGGMEWKGITYLIIYILSCGVEIKLFSFFPHILYLNSFAFL